MTMAIAPGNAADKVYGYAWTWRSPGGAPVYSSLPSCGSAGGGIHFVCGSSVAVRVAPVQPLFAEFTVWAFTAGGQRSPARTVIVNTVHDIPALYPVTHQWTTDQYSAVPAVSNCGDGGVTVACVADTAGVDTQHPNGARPLVLPPGVTWDGSGGVNGGVPGVLTLGSANQLPAATLGSVVDTRQSFSVGAWLTPTASPAGAPATAVAEEGPGGTGFELGLTGDGHWQFRVHSASTSAIAALEGSAASAGVPVNVAGVADAVNRELRLYVNGSLATVVGFAPAPGHSPDGAATVGGRVGRTGVEERWIGQIGNPVLAQAALPAVDLSALSFESFFPHSNPDWDLN
jgi:hypothetical protein